MASFWQLSGRESHLKREWKGRRSANVAIADDVFNALSLKQEDGGYRLELILGIELSGASHILIPYHWRDRCRHLNWGPNSPYSNLRFESLSPIHIETPLRLHALLDDRQNVSKGTKAGKQRGDTSKANGPFWNGVPNPSRAAFEHGRCLWRIIQNEIEPQIYGLSEDTLGRRAAIFSLALNFWAPNGVQFTTKLIDASLVKCATHSDEIAGVARDSTWYFKAKENVGLQNSFGSEDMAIQEAWNTKMLRQDEIGPQIQSLLTDHAHLNSTSPMPIVLLVHDYSKVEENLITLGITTTAWVVGVADLLHKNGRNIKKAEYSPTYRARSASPRSSSSNSFPLKKEDSPDSLQLHPSVYIVDTMAMFKAAAESGVHSSRIRPLDVFNVITGRDEHDTWCAGNDAHYILESWKKLVQGPTIDEQRAFFGELTHRASWMAQGEYSRVAGTEAPEADGLYEMQQIVDKYKDDGGSDSETEWYSITKA